MENLKTSILQDIEQLKNRKENLQKQKIVAEQLLKKFDSLKKMLEKEKKKSDSFASARAKFK